MQGEVFVPYTGIGGENMQATVDLYGLTGSTHEHANDDQISTTFGVKWSYPGGIVNGGTQSFGFWGYAIYRKSDNGTYTYDADVLNWLLGTTTEKPPRYQVPRQFTQTEIDNGDPAVIQAINNMVLTYLNELMFVAGEGDLTLFKQVFGTCTYPA